MEVHDKAQNGGPQSGTKAAPARSAGTAEGGRQGKILALRRRGLKALLTLALILWVLSLGLSRHIYSTTFGVVDSLVFASLVIIHLRIRPRWLDVGLIVLITAFLATVHFHMFGSVPVLGYFSFLGLSSLVILAVRSIWEQERIFLVCAWVPAAMFVLAGPFVQALGEWTVKAHPKTLDLYLLSFDGSLGIQLAFSVGRAYARIAWLHNSALIAYLGVTFPLALVYAGRLMRFREGAFPSVLTFLTAGPIGFLFYNLFPACGPLYVFGRAFPFQPLPLAVLSRLRLEPTAIVGWRNAMPSLHLAWTLLAWWHSKGLSWIERLICFLFLALTVVATMGKGEHWFVDLIVAYPYALLIDAICAYEVSWKDTSRRYAFFLGLGATLGWMAALRYGTALFWTSPTVPWALSAATILLISLRRGKLDSAASRAEPQAFRLGGFSLGA